MTSSLRLHDFFQFAEQLSELVTLSNPNGIHLFFNQSFIDTTGYSTRDLDDAPLDRMVYGDDLAIVFDAIEKMLSGSDPSVFRFRMISKQGAILNLESRLCLFRRPETDDRYIVSISRRLDYNHLKGLRDSDIFEQARKLAALEERQRLARDLHDAVSQTLFSASVIAETLPILIDSNPDEVVKGLNKLAALTKGALAEMRTLLVELRPTALAEIELSQLLTYLVNSFRTRLEGEIDFENHGCGKTIFTETKVSIYRIAQESLNNIVRHARASKISVRLECQDSLVSLEIRDNGRGFDAKSVSASHLGLRIMYERAEAAGIELDITSETGQGTLVRVVKND